MVATDQQQPHLGLLDRAVLVQVVGGQHQGLHGLRQRQAEQRRHVFAGAFARRGRLGQRLRGHASGGQQRQGLGKLDVGGVVAGGAIHDGVFAGVGDDLEFMRAVAADRAGVGRDGAVLQAEALEDAAVGRVHVVVAAAGGLDITVEGIGVLHRELAATHQAKARAALVAELGLDVIEVFRQLAVAAQLLAGDVGDDLFARRLHDEVASMAVLHAQQFRAHLVEAAGLLPQLGGLDHRHQAFDGAGRVHLLADDLLDLADDPKPHRHVVVNAGAQALDHAGAHHQLVADDLGIGRRFLEGGDEELGGFHGRTERGTGTAWQCEGRVKTRPSHDKTGGNLRVCEGATAIAARCNNRTN
mmetsp:Transcript_53733/g.126540  ORF Transcript_53733/g.126540 Transcript_53733/m.126540 type:complete len:357 (-) Transcript_53733:266-1336(-)